MSAERPDMSTDPHEAPCLITAAPANGIDKAYRKRVRNFHPDKAGVVQRFKAISAACAVFKDTEIRARYDAGEIDGMGTKRPQPEYFRDSADAPHNSYQQQRGFDGGGGAAGDGLGAVMICMQSVYRRTGNDIELVQSVTFDDAILGGKVAVPTTDASVGPAIPAGASSGRLWCLRGRGVVRTERNIRDDHKILMPIKTDTGYQNVLTEWRKDHAVDPRADVMKGATI